MRYKMLEHTADALVEAYGKDQSERFGNAAYALFDIITDVDAVKPVGEMKLTVSADNHERLLVDFLQELLYLNDAENYVFCEFEVDIRNGSLEAVVRGEEFDQDRHPKKTVVKGVSYHALRFEDDRIVVLFDV